MNEQEQVVESINESVTLVGEVEDAIALNTESTSNEKEAISYGKFKNADALLKAYNSLEAEFTKKSQKLKEIELNKVELLKNTDKEVTPDKENMSDTSLESKPQYLESNWDRKVSEFIRENPKARDFAEEISSEIIQDQALSLNKECLDIALNRVLARKYQSAEQLLEDNDFLSNHIFRNDSIKDKIIADYIENLSSSRPPKVISKRGEVSLTPPTKPKTLKEAGALANKYFNRR